jgi:hypothetical protein
VEGGEAGDLVEDLRRIVAVKAGMIRRRALVRDLRLPRLAAETFERPSARWSAIA